LLDPTSAPCTRYFRAARRRTFAKQREIADPFVGLGVVWLAALRDDHLGSIEEVPWSTRSSATTLRPDSVLTTETTIVIWPPV
jgi:hypothetical protein